MTNKELLEEYNKKMEELFKDKKGKIPMVTIKETFCEFDRNNPDLISRELLIDSQSVLTMEYANNKPVRAVTDKNGKRIILASIDEKDKVDTSLKDVVTEKLEKLTSSREESKAPKAASKAPTERKVQRTIVSQDAANYINRRGQETKN